MLAAFGAPLGKTRARELAKELGIVGLDAASITHASFDAELARLDSRGLIVRSDTGIACAPVYAHGAFKAAIAHKRIVSWREPLLAAHGVKAAYWYPESNRHLVGVLRLALCTGLPPKRIDALVGRIQASEPGNVYREAFALPFDADVIATIPSVYRDAVVGTLLQGALHAPFPTVPAAVAWAETRCVASAKDGSSSAPLPLKLDTCEQLLWQGRFAAADALLAPIVDDFTPALRASSAAMRGEYQKATAMFDGAFTTLRKSDKSLYGRLPLSVAWFRIASLVATDTPASLTEAQRLCRGELRAWGGAAVWQTFEQTVAARQGSVAQRALPIIIAGHDGLADLVRIICKAWLRVRLGKTEATFAQRWLDAYRDAGYAWAARELEAGITIANGGQVDASLANTLAAVFAAETPWRRAIAAIAALSETKRETERETRIAWVLDPDAFGGYTVSIEPYSQTRAAKRWSRGSRTSLAKLRRIDRLDPQDAQVCRNIEQISANRYSLDPMRALPALIGHPSVFFAADLGTPVELFAAEPELIIERSHGGVRVHLEPDPNRVLADYESAVASGATPRSGGDLCVLVRKSATRAAVVRLTAAHQRVAKHLGHGLTVPEEGIEDLNQAVAAVAHLFDVHSAVQAALPEVIGDPRPHAELAPVGGGLRMRVAVRPFGTGGPRYLPGVGGSRVIAEVAGERRAAVRDLAIERIAALRVLDAAAVVADPGGTFEWQLDDAEDCLTLVEALQAMGDEVLVEWPEGARLHVTRAYRVDDLRVSVEGGRDWFGVSGNLTLDDGTVLEMRRLIESARAGRGRFISLGEAGFVALTEDLKQKLDELARTGDTTEEGLRVSPIALGALSETLDGVQLTTDDEWQVRLQRLRELEALHVEPSSTLQAELRPYQVDGFRWLARLAYWGAGACLADDMGLGKTVQALALMLRRAPNGAALVIAPTSVCANWVAETQRFAPTLRVLEYRDGDRPAILRDAESYDVVVCSYALLQQDVKAFTKRTWHTLVLDEAQVVKNFATKRAQAVLELEAEFRLVTTGTPVENRLDELWMLFRFLNPGLLGSREHFNTRFAVPIERHHDVAARAHLRKLLRPFVLRRTKAEVLTELPERTEIALEIECDEREKAFREALRQSALAAIANDPDPGNRQRFRVLAELMRVRRACCDPRLVVPNADVPGAKLDAFAELAQELVANRHKALVFSQFVDFLTLLRARLDALGFAYQYLDGATPAPERARRVNAFQAGEGDFFLISLRAGGFGLNLTAADYVIITDPWWNPAVEDQAAGRAHRMGQLRPVTVYRLVAKDSIEQRIMAMHAEKRALAEGLFNGEEFGSALSVEDLVALLKEA